MAAAPLALLDDREVPGCEPGRPRGRSRSPRGASQEAGSAAALMLDSSRMELRMGSAVAKVFYFADAPEMPRFQAKPIMTHLGLVNITRTLDRWNPTRSRPQRPRKKQGSASWRSFNA